jgi:SAM-dependent methyltransferase
MPVRTPDLLTRLRAGLRLRQRLRPPAEVKGDEELAWWLRSWNPALADDALVPDDVLALLPDACPARISIGVEPLAHRFADAGLLLASDAIYLAARAEAIPLISGTVDVVVARNSLDHVDDPRAAVAEARRLLRPGGTLILNFDVNHTPTPTEPHTLDAEQVRSWLRPMALVFEDAWAHPHGHDGHAVVLVATQP